MLTIGYKIYTRTVSNTDARAFIIGMKLFKFQIQPQCRRLLTTKMSKNLAAFDFDHTVCLDNTDIVIRDLLDANVIPESVKNLYKSTGWTEYMGEIFRLVHEHGIKADNVRTKIRQIPEVPGMVQCIKVLQQNNFDVIIISDSNSEFIREWLEHNELDKQVHSVFTNPAEFNEKGMLVIRPFHHQTECQLSSVNLCKGKILEDFLEASGALYDKVYFMGDGRNDICPMLRIKRGYMCPREGFYCSKELENVIASVNHDLPAKIQRWTDGTDLLNFLLASRHD
jgi:pyridoxal phosphate phosphatase PHOSPHO2